MEWSIQFVLVQVTLAVATIFGLLYFYVTGRYDYWKKKGVPYLEPAFPFGNVKDLILAKVPFGRFYERFYKEFKNKQYGGIYELGKPVLIVTDLDLVRQIMTKDFAYFMDWALPPLSPKDFLAHHLFAMKGKEWKDMRTKLTPTFSSGRMKQMYTLIEKCSYQLQHHLEYLTMKSQVIEVKELMSRFTIDIIATCAFGLEVNTLEDSNTDFFEVSQLIFKTTKPVLIKRFFMSIFPRVAEILQMSLFHPKVSNFILNLVETTVTYREQNSVDRNDFLDLLIKVKNNQSLDENSSSKNSNDMKKSLTSKEMAAQAFIFFAAGFETAASTTTFVLYELAQNPEVQEKLRREIEEVVENHEGKITYEALQQMSYMEQVVNETLRLYASIPILVRKCVEPYTIPETNITLDKDVKVIIPSYAIHHDPEIYPDPFVFDPDRFSEENVKSRHNYAFLPFGEGPRTCIGMRFGKMQVKAGLATVLTNFELSATPDTPIPVEIAPGSIVTTALRPIMLKFTKRSY